MHVPNNNVSVFHGIGLEIVMDHGHGVDEPSEGGRGWVPWNEMKWNDDVGSERKGGGWGVME